MSNSQTFDILVTVDADYLLAPGFDGNVGKAISMVVSRSAIDPNADINDGEGEGGNELWIDVKQGDNIRWRATTLSRNFDQIALIRGVQGYSDDDRYKGAIGKAFSENYSGVPVAYLDGQTIKSTPVTYTVWQAEATTPGKLWYTVTFDLLGRDLKPLKSGLYWDPYITVSI